MNESEYRLGDLIDDFCPRCRLLLNHAVASLVERKVVKVICQTCHSEHPYRRGEGGKKKKPPSARAGLFEQVLSNTGSTVSSAADAPESVTGNRKKKRATAVARYISRHKTDHRKGPDKRIG